ncbi:hypothetical protein GYMLUDRAFT_981264, partial [Collybiopsis luxurians FD-317 M1]
IALIRTMQYVFTDGVVVWRAWILCKDDNKKALFFCIFSSLCATCCSTLATIIIAFLQNFTSQDIERENRLKRAIDVCHVADLVLSLATNLLATSIISLRAWHFRRMFHLTWANGGRILALLIESGVLYSLLLVINLISVIIRLPLGTLGDLCNPVYLQIAGMYPLVILILASRDQSLDGSLSTRRHHSTAFTSILESDNDQNT